MTQETQIQNASADLSVFKSDTFDSIARIASKLAESSLIPDSFKGDGKTTYPPEKVAANCFLVVEQAHRWGMSPFSVMGCASVIHGKLMWEGKLIHAVIEEKLGIRLKYEFNDKSGDAFGVTVSGTFPGEDKPEAIEGTVGDWKTTANNSPWTKLSQRKSMLRYRGAREWARAHAPGVMLGIVTQDEAQDFENMKPATPADDEPINPFGEKPEKLTEASGKPELAKTSTTEADDKRAAMIDEIGDLAKKLGKTEGDWKKVFAHYGAESLEAMKDIELRSILAKLKKETPEELDLEGDVG